MLLTFLSIGSADAAPWTLQWNPNPEPTVAGYIVSYGTRSGEYTAAINVGNQTAYHFEGPTAPTVYYFVVRAYNTNGVPGLPSAEVSTGSAPAPAPVPICLAEIRPSATAPQLTGTAVTFQAIATGGVLPYQYKWLIFDGRNWSVGADWQTSDIFTWRPLTANPDYRVGVWVRSATSTEDAPDNEDAGTSIPFGMTAAKDASPATKPSRSPGSGHAH